MADGRDQGTGIRDRGADNDRAGRVPASGGGAGERKRAVRYVYPVWHTYSRGDGYTHVYTIEYSDAQPYTVTDAKRNDDEHTDDHCRRYGNPDT